ncbi:hypothetical protein GCM10007304_01290 [Rhodococcoides trifolii]|uniref:Uncharacterized protein n=1 Tax=Rhodococcoides trifolii TaxID=908250 RepID=A0A917CMJ2_9NOCA|nr:hypothetical protein GCM10007304_01290 [Rhodococcus trifolii]
MQRGRGFESNGYVSVRLPSLIADEPVQVAGERLRGELAVLGQLLVIGLVDRDDVGIGGEEVTSVELFDLVGRFLLQRCFDLLRHDTTAEYAGKGVADGSLELPFEPLDHSHD